jgi:hypothetical protein
MQVRPRTTNEINMRKDYKTINLNCDDISERICRCGAEIGPHNDNELCDDCVLESEMDNEFLESFYFGENDD